MKLRGAYFRTVLLVSAVVFSLPLQAQTENGTRNKKGTQLEKGTLEEIVVTAQKRSESLQQVPTAISAITDSDLTNKAMVNLQDIKTLVPNLYMEPALSAVTTPKLFMRGVGVDNQVFSFDTPIGIYVDGVYLARVTGAMVDLFDVKRIEVLRGPQSVLYGRNNSAGAIRIITKDPVLQGSDLKAEVAYGSKNQINASGTFSMALIPDKLGIRVAAETRNNDGYMKDLTTGRRTDNNDIKAFRGSLLWQANDDWRFYLRGDYMADDSSPPQGSNFLVNPDHNIYTYESTPSAPFYNKIAPWGVSLDAQGTIGNIKVNSITAYRGLKYRNANDVDGLAAVRSFEVDRQDLNEHQFTQEVYFSGDSIGALKLNWVAGAFYFHEYNEFFWALRIFAPPTTQVFHQYTDSAALYFNGAYPVTDRLTLSAGARYTHESKKFNAIQYLPDGTLNTSFRFNDKKTASEWTWQASAKYEVTDNIMAYARGATGFRSGGFNGSARDIPSILSGGFGVEHSTSAEAGFKSNLFGNRLRLNADYFWVLYEGLQLAVTKSDGTITSTNVQATVHGLELTAHAVPIDGLDLTATIGTMFSNIKDSPLKLKDTPEFSGDFGAVYTFPLNIAYGGDVSIGGDVRIATDSYSDTNNAPYTNTGSYAILNAHMTYHFPNRHWQVSLAGYNLTDKYVPLHVFNIAGGFISSVAFPNLPRRWLLSLQYEM